MILNVQSSDRHHEAEAGLCNEGPEKQRLSPSNAASLTVDAWTFRSPPGDATFIAGGVGRDIEHVEIRTDGGGVVEATLVTPLDSVEVPFDVFFGIVVGHRSGEAVGLSKEGNESDSVPFQPRLLNRLPGDLVACGDRYGNIVGHLPTGDGGQLRGTWQAPGSSDVGPAKIRKIARSPLQDVWSRVAPWWEARPDPGSDDQSFLDWWAAYPVRE